MFVFCSCLRPTSGMGEVGTSWALLGWGTPGFVVGSLSLARLLHVHATSGKLLGRVTCAISSPLSLPELLPSSYRLWQRPTAPGSVLASPRLRSVTNVFRGYACPGLRFVPLAVQVAMPRLSRVYWETHRLPMGHSTHQDEVFRHNGRRRWLSLPGPVISASLGGASLEAGQPPLPSCPAGAWSGRAPLTLSQQNPRVLSRPHGTA